MLGECVDNGKKNWVFLCKSCAVVETVDPNGQRAIRGNLYMMQNCDNFMRAAIAFQVLQVRERYNGEGTGHVTIGITADSDI